MRDVYRSYYCICFPPQLLLASAVLTAAMFLKIPLSPVHLKPGILEMPVLASVEEDYRVAIRNFPWTALFDCEFEEMMQVSELLLKFLRFIKYEATTN